MAFSIQHPDLTSALVAPANALTARFLGVSCSINISSPRKDVAPPEPVVEKLGRPCKKRKVHEEMASKGASEDGDIYDGLTTENHQAIDDFLSSLNLQLVDGNQLGGRAERHQQHTRGAEEILASPTIPDLLQTALKMLVLGGSGTHKGISVLEGKSFQGLKELVPAVFHFPYLEVSLQVSLHVFAANGFVQTVSSRARLLPAIATSLARMANAESPVLRLKVASFASNVAKDGDYSGSPVNSDSIVCGIEKAAWETILATTKKPVLRSRRRDDPTTGGEQFEDDQGGTASQNLSKTPPQPENYGEGYMTTNEMLQNWAFSAEQSPCVKSDVPIEHPFFTSSLTSSPVFDSSFCYSYDAFVPESPFSDSLVTSNTQSSQSSATWSMSPLKADAQYGEENQESVMQIYDPGEFEGFEEWNMAMEAQYSVIS